MSLVKRSLLALGLTASVAAPAAAEWVNCALCTDFMLPVGYPKECHNECEGAGGGITADSDIVLRRGMIALLNGGELFLVLEDAHQISLTSFRMVWALTSEGTWEAATPEELVQSCNGG